MAPRSPRVPGFRAAGVCCGIKLDGPDLALIVSDVPAAVAGVFTKSSVVGAPVEICRARVRSGRGRGVVVNSGCSNVAMGARGLRDARRMAECAAQAIGVPSEEMLVASTGVIGEPLPMTKIRRGVKEAAGALDAGGLLRAAEAIMTTDTFAKIATTTLRLGRREVTVAGIAKGSGMLEPNMATMLGYLITDAAVAPAYLRRALRAVVDESFNRVTVDGETSTSDTVLLFANGMADNTTLRDERTSGAGKFVAAVRDVATSLARDLARDGEGATKLITVNIEGARTPAEAERAARRVANSLLVKTAIFGGDPNWGRILQTLGAGRVHIGLERAEIKLGGVTVFRSGASAGPAARRRAAQQLKRNEVEIAVKLAAGRSRASVWTCDLSYDYVRINAEYTS